jgi:hypothetical protein
MWAMLVVVAAVGCGFQHGAAREDAGATGDGALARDAATPTDATADAMIDAGPGTVVITLAPSQDTWLRQQYPTDVEIMDHLDGESLDLRCGSGSTTSRANRAILQFDLSPVPGNCNVASAQMFLYYYGDETTVVSSSLEAHRITRVWSDASASWTTPWSAAGGDYSTIASAVTTLSANAHGWVSWDLATLVSGWLNQSVPNDGVELLEANDNAGNMGRKLFYSSRAAQDHPYLQVTCM